MITKHPRGTARPLAAVLAALVVALVGLAIPSSAGASGTWSTTATVTEANATDGLKVLVEGTDYTNLPNSSLGSPAVGVYAGLRNPADSYDDIAADTSLSLGTKFLYNAGVAQPDWSTTVAVPAADLDPDVDYEIIVWAAHGNPTDTTVLDTIPVNLTVAQKQALFPGWTPPPWSTTATVTEANATDGLKVLVEGTDYTNLPNSSLGSPAVGVYAGLRNPADSYEDIAADTSLSLGTKFLYNAGVAQPDWSTTVAVPAADLDPDVDYEIIVWAAHGNPTDTTVLDTIPVNLTVAQKQALFPGWTPPTVPPTDPPSSDGFTTTVSVTAAGVTDGLKLQVHGAGFTGLPSASGGGPAQGVYVALRDPATMSNAAINADNGIVPAVTFIPSAAIQGGTWTVTLDAEASGLDPDALYEVIVWVAHGDLTGDTLLTTTPVTLTSAQHDALFPGGKTPPPTSAPPTTRPGGSTPGTAPAATTPTVQRTTHTDATGLRCVTDITSGTVGTPQLTWGVRSSFVNYVESNVAKGSIDTGDGAVRSGNTFTWPNGSGEVDDAGRGTWTFRGYVHFSGHNDVLNTTLSNLRINADGSGNGTLVADVHSQDMDGNDVSGNDMTIASLRFSSISSAGGTASASLTADGARALNNMYEPGESMDPVTVSVSGATAGSTVENCYDAAGNLVTSTPVGATTGGAGTLPVTGVAAWRLAATGLAMLVMGMLALAVTTRRRAHLRVR